MIKINRLGKHIQSKFAHKYFAEMTIGLDFTARDVQQKLKEKGLPWEKAKAFDSSAVVGEWIPVEGQNLGNLNFELRKNGEIVQKGNTSDMLFSFGELIEHTSKYFTLKIGDLIFSGTPEGVGPVAKGDLLEGFIGKQLLLKVKVR